MECYAETVSPSKSRKKKSQPEKWKRNAAKKIRHSPKELPIYPGCGHSSKAYRCTELTMADIAAFHKQFYATTNKQLQDAFLIRYIRTPTCKRMRPKDQSRKKKTTTIKCLVRTRQKMLVPVCQASFLKILNISKHRLQFVAKNYRATGNSPKERRGGDRVSQKFQKKKESVKKFIKRFTCVEAHYTRTSSIRRYLPSYLNIKKMTTMYNLEMQTLEMENLKVKDCFFRKVFNTCFNLGFGTPRTDVCSTCLSLDEQIKQSVSATIKNELMIKKRVHKLRAKAFYSFLKMKSDDILTLSFDCQKNQVLPKVPDQSAYYSRQLYIYNLCIVQGSSRDKKTKKNTFMYTWTEDEFAKGSNEVACAIIHRLNNTDFSGIKTLRLMCDGCGGQNKNCIMISACCSWFLDAPSSLKLIELIYPVTGHSFLPSDRVFGRIENEVKKLEVITSPEEYKQLFKKFGNVIEMGTDCEVKDWRTEAYKILRSTASWHFKFNESKRFILSKTKNKESVLIRGEPHYRSDVCNPKSVCKKGKRFQMMQPTLIAKGSVKVNSLKLNDVNKLLEKHYGSDWKTLECLKYFVNVLEKNNYSGDIANENIDETVIIEQQQLEETNILMI